MHPRRWTFSELRSTGAVLLSLLLFFQLGNEWALAGWLPLFLSQRLGISPPTALGMLALYWLALTIGRAASQWILPRARHGRLLLGTVTAAMFGCIILGATDNRFGAITGVLLVGGASLRFIRWWWRKSVTGSRIITPAFTTGSFRLRWQEDCSLRD